MKKELQQSALSQIQLTLELSPEARKPRGGRKSSSSRSMESGSSPSTASSTPRSKLSLDETMVSRPTIQEEEASKPKQKATARATSGYNTSSESGSTAGSKSYESADSKSERQRARSSSGPPKAKRKGKKPPSAPPPKSSEEPFKGDVPPSPPRKAPESFFSEQFRHTPRPDVMQPSLQRSYASLIVSKSTISRQVNRPRPRQLNGVMVSAGARPSMGRKSKSERFMSGSIRSINSNSSPTHQPEDASSPQPEEDEKIIRSSNGKGLETPKRSKRILNVLRRSFSFSKKGPRRSKSESNVSITPRQDLSFFLNNPEKQQQPSAEQTVGTMSITERSSSSCNSNMLINSPLPPKESSPTKPTRSNSFFNLDRLRAEVGGPGLVQGAEGLPIVDPQWMAEVVKGSVSPGLGGHLEQMEQENEHAEKDVDEASDIISLPAENVPATRKVSRSKSSSRKQSNKPRNMRRSSPNSKGQSVSFHAVIIRDYERCVGDNPAVSSGPPISLGWDYLTNREVSVDHYEADIRLSGPRTRKDFFLTPQKRFHILLDEWGFCVREICRAKDEAAEIKYQRHQSCFGEGSVPILSSGSPTKSPSLLVKKQGSRSSGNSSKPAYNTMLPPPSPSPSQAQDRWKTSCPASPNAVTA
jgi:hypothetical protein